MFISLTYHTSIFLSVNEPGLPAYKKHGGHTKYYMTLKLNYMKAVKPNNVSYLRILFH